MPPPLRDWAIVVPVKGGPLAKSRLPVPRPTRTALADAFARDTVAAITVGAPGSTVVVVGGDDLVRNWARAAGAHWLTDPGAGLDAAVAAGAAAGSSSGCRQAAVVFADHPALRPAEMSTALAEAGRVARVVVPDADDDGTALLTFPTTQPPRTAFGPGSAAAHQRLGHARMPLDLPGLVRDVDDATSLAVAVRLGVGPSTRAALARATLPGMQATIHTTADDGSGSALLDDGIEVAVPAGAAVHSGLRHLRVGQRVSVELDDTGRAAVRVWVVGVGPGETIG